MCTVALFLWGNNPVNLSGAVGGVQAFQGTVHASQQYFIKSKLVVYAKWAGRSSVQCGVDGFVTRGPDWKGSHRTRQGHFAAAGLRFSKGQPVTVRDQTAAKHTVSIVLEIMRRSAGLDPHGTANCASERVNTWGLHSLWQTLLSFRYSPEREHMGKAL